jgi:hypothetical protein
LRLAKTGERLRPEVFQIEKPADLPARRIANNQRVRGGQALQSGGEVGRLANDPALLCGTLADQIADHGKPSGDAETHAQILSRRQAADRLDYRQPGAHRTLGIVLMRPRITEIDQHPVAHIFRDKAVEAADRIADRTVVAADQLPQILRVMAGRQCRRADQITEHHRQLAAFGVGGSRCITERRYHCGVGHQGAERGDRIQQLAPVADRCNADLFEIFRRQLRQHLPIDLIVAEGWHIALKAQTL